MDIDGIKLYEDTTCCLERVGLNKPPEQSSASFMFQKLVTLVGPTCAAPWHFLVRWSAPRPLKDEICFNALKLEKKKVTQIF